MYAQIILLLLSTFFATTAVAQTTIGVVAGVSASRPSYRSSDFREYHSAGVGPGYAVGVHLQFDIIDRIGLVFEPAWSVKGWKVNSRLSDYAWDRINMHMIDLPALVRFNGGRKHYRYYLNAGPELNFWLGGRGEVGIADQNQGVTNVYPYRLNFGGYRPDMTYMNMMDANRVQISFVAGAGIQFELKENRFAGLDVRYAFGNTFFGANPGGEIPMLGVTENFEAGLNVLSLRATYSISLQSRYPQQKK
jgi:opacity protein-like surface antigen